MREKKWYISLKCKGANAYHHDGQRLNLTEKTVNIGESADCDVRYENGDFRPEYYATIVRNEDGRSWRIIQRSPHAGVSIDGKGPIGYACPLDDGDIISFEGQDMALQFNSHHDDKYCEKDKRRSNMHAWIAAAAAVVTLFAVLLYLQFRQGPISEQEVASLEESIYRIKVDSVVQVLTTDGQEKQLRPAMVPNDGAPSGTAFLTTDSLLVTARHCVEYWLGTALDLTTRVSRLDDDDIVKWAIETETFNQTHENDSTMRLKVYFSVYDCIGEKKYAFCSTDSRVHINTAHDGIFMLADFDEQYYWRSIRPYFVERKMELGDILWIDGIADRGKVRLATDEEIAKLHNGSQLMICGYPMTGIADDHLTCTGGIIRRKVNHEAENLFFEGNINHGYSGGPVFIKTGNGIAAAGVVSRVDSVSSGLFKWAVPVSQIHHTQGGPSHE